MVDYTGIGLYELTAELIQTGLRLSANSESDAWLTDQAFWDKPASCPDQVLQAQLAQLRPKIRTINPAVWLKGKGIRLSNLDADFAHDSAAYQQRRQGVLSLAIAP